jgi:hypothetical protein
VGKRHETPRWLTVRCPKCNAAPGDKCRNLWDSVTNGGRGKQLVRAHNQRIALAAMEVTSDG